MYDDEDEGEEEDYEYREEALIPSAQGCIDLMQFFNAERINKDKEVYIYRINSNYLNIHTIISNWHFKSPAPLIRNIQLSNFVFITMESIFNPTSEMISSYRDLEVRLSIQSKSDIKLKATSTLISTPGSDANQMELCTFTNFFLTTVCDQTSYIIWESLQDECINNLQCQGVSTGLRTKKTRFNEGLVFAENSDLNLNNIDPKIDNIIACNSMHRFALTTESYQIIEKATVFDKNQILVEVFDRNVPLTTLLTGYLDLSILFYPFDLYKY